MTGGAKMVEWGGHHGGWGGFGPPSYIVKKCPESATTTATFEQKKFATDYSYRLKNVANYFAISVHNIFLILLYLEHLL